MATNEIAVENGGTGAPVSAKVPLVPMVTAVFAAVVLAATLVSCGLYLLVRSGRLPLPTNMPLVAKVEAAAPVETHAMVLEPLVVNLSDAGGKAYLRVALTLRVVDTDDKKEVKTKEEKPKDAKSGGEDEAAARDTVLTVLGRDTADGLLAADGKEHAKVELKAALAEHVPEIKVADIFFTDFLVQR